MVLSFRVYCVLPCLCKSYAPTLMPIGLVILRIASLPLDSMFSLEIHSSLGRARSRMLFLALPLKLSIALWLRLHVRLFGYAGYLLLWVSLFLILRRYTVIIRVPFRLLVTRSFMSEPNILRLIVITPAIIYSLVQSHCHMFPLHFRLPIYSRRLIPLRASAS